MVKRSAIAIKRLETKKDVCTVWETVKQFPHGGIAAKTCIIHVRKKTFPYSLGDTKTIFTRCYHDKKHLHFFIRLADVDMYLETFF